jgi:catechol 2,3-dioxygenase-like lactoylglutathione lyase family enzyme
MAYSADRAVIDHITIRVSDRAGSEAFYDLVLHAIGIDQSGRDDAYTVWSGQFSLAQADDDHPVTRRLHIGFGAASQELVDAFWRAGTEAGYRDDGAPGSRPEYGPTYYGGFLLDPDGNSEEAVHHDTVAGRVIDHLWIRVADLQASRAFYERVAPFGGFRLNRERPDRVQFTSLDDSFSVVQAGEPTEQLHVAFEAHDNDTVDAFHRELTAAGYADNGPPGERDYHPGYYGAFVLDPDGNNVEVVNHNRS